MTTPGNIEDLCKEVETQTSYDLYKILESFRKIRKIGVEDGCKYGYSKMVLTGKLDHCDYGAGFINFKIYYCRQPDGHFARIWMETTDDGDMGAWVEFDTEEEAIKMIDTFAENFLQNLEVFPTLEDLNKEVCSYGIWISVE